MSSLKRLLVPSYSDWLFLALIVWLFAVGSGWELLLADGDTGWHIRTGEYILAHHAVPRTDLFSFSRPGAPWYAWEWLSDVLFALAQRWGGLKGVALLAGASIATFLTVLFRHMLARGGNLFLALAACLLAAGASSIHFLARPHVFTLPLLAVSLWLLGRDRRRPGRAVWLLAPLTALWANLHGGFVALLVSIAILLGAAALGRCWRLAGRYAALAGACLAASLVNPYGIGLHRHILEYLRSDWIRQAVDEFQSPTFRSENSLHFEILLFAGLMAAASLAGRRRSGEALLVVAWAHAALVSARNIPLFAVAACPILVAQASRWWSAWVEGRPARSIAAIVDRMAVEFAAGARRTSLWPVVLLLVLPCVPLHWPRGFPEVKFPVRLVERQQSAIRGARVFTSDQWGDYLIYRFFPRQTVFFDGRSDFYGPEMGKLYLRTAYGKPGWRETLERFGIRLALVPQDWPLASLLRQSADWRLVDQEGQAALFEQMLPQVHSELKKTPQAAEIPLRSR